MSFETGVYAMLLSAIGAGAMVVVLIRAIVHKLSGFEYFVATLGEYRLIPQSAAFVTAILLVVLEAIVVVLTVFPETFSTGMLLAVALFLIYAAAMGINLWRGRVEIDCGCGGSTHALSGWLIVRNMAFVTICMWVAWQGAPTNLSAGDMLIVLGGIFLSSLLLLVFDQILGNHSHVTVISHSRT